MLGEKSIHDDTEILRLKEKVEPETIVRDNRTNGEERSTFIRERREIVAPTALSPIHEDEEKSPVRLRSPITITRFRRPMRAKLGRRNSASMAEIQTPTHETESPSAILDLAMLSPDSPTRPPSPLVLSPMRQSPIMQGSPMKRSPFRQSPIRSLQIFQSESPPFRRLSPARRLIPATIDRSPIPLNVRTTASPMKAAVLQPRSPNRPTLSASKPQRLKPLSFATPSPLGRSAHSPAKEQSSIQDTPVPGSKDQENAGHSRRRRDSKTVSYAEPSLRKKMRRQSANLVDAAAQGSMIN